VYPNLQTLRSGMGFGWIIAIVVLFAVIVVVAALSASNLTFRRCKRCDTN
jgi:hypothetical protein